MDYQTIKQLNDQMKRQIEVLNYMDDLIREDKEYVEANPQESLPPIQNIGVLKSHFLTQKKACESVLSLTQRHLPRLKKEKDESTTKAKKQAKNNPIVKLIEEIDQGNFEYATNQEVPKLPKGIEFTSLFDNMESA